MFYPNLKSPPTTRRVIDTFRGINQGEDIGAGEFRDMKNLSSRHYPLLAPRGPRESLQKLTLPQGLMGNDCLCWVDNGKFYIDGALVEGLALATACGTCAQKAACPKYVSGKTRCEKTLLSMGAYTLIFPDKKWVLNTDGTITHGDIEASFTAMADPVTYTLCRENGDSFEAVSPIQPANPADGDLWISDGLKQWSSDADAWVSVSASYVRLDCPNIGKNFSKFDAVSLSGLPEGLNGSAVLWHVEKDAIVIQGTVTAAGAARNVSVRRQLPLMDFVTVCGNRLWGCRYGKDRGGNFVNEIYCSKLGDFKNFQCFMGVSTDSGVISVGSRGPFTAAFTYQDHPLFFKEEVIHKVFVSSNAAHSVSDILCPGVGAGCENSLAVAGGRLCYQGRNSLWAYDGGSPRCISEKLADESCQFSCAAGNREKYYVYRNKFLWVYDTRHGLWHREDNLPIISLCAQGGHIYAATGTELLNLTANPGQETLSWWGETGDLGGFTPDSKYLKKLTARLTLEQGASVNFLVRYDHADHWQTLGVVNGDRLKSVQFSLLPQRCDTLRLCIQGVGNAKIHAITKTYERGSDSP